jgi:hypothetical protein
MDEMKEKLDEMIGPDHEAALWDAHQFIPFEMCSTHCFVLPGNNILKEQDRDNVRAFKLTMIARMLRTAYNQMVYTFDHKMDLSSEWDMLHRMAILSGIEPV